MRFMCCEDGCGRDAEIGRAACRLHLLLDALVVAAVGLSAVALVSLAALAAAAVLG